MTVHIAQTPQEFREKIIELGANAISYKNGECLVTVRLDDKTPERIQRIFNDCVGFMARRVPEETFVPLFFDAYKDGTPIVSGRWTMMRILYSSIS